MELRMPLRYYRWNTIFILLIVVFVVIFWPLGPDQVRQLITAPLNKSKKAHFIEKFSSSEIDGSPNVTAFQELCASKTWRKGLVFKCSDPGTGMTNIRNIFLNCLRYAIEAGAGFVAPSLSGRNSSDISQFSKENNLPYSHFFDTDHLIESLSHACPQMNVYRSTDGLIPQSEPAPLSTSILGGGLRDWVLKSPQTWSSKFDSWIEIQPGYPPPNSTHFIVNLLRPLLLQWPVDYDPPEFQSQYGRVIRSRSDILELAASTVLAMSQRFGFSPQAGLITKDAFYGVHLRTEADAQKAGWEGYKKQSMQFLKDAERRKLNLIYVASGSEREIDRFKADAWNKSQIAVVSKLDLLEEQDRANLTSLTFDQQGLVDYEVMLRSSFFGGVPLSSFSWNIAFRRHGVALQAGMGSFQSNSTGAFNDSLSTLFEMHKNGDAKAVDGECFILGIWP